MHVLHRCTCIILVTSSLLVVFATFTSLLLSHLQWIMIDASLRKYDQHREWVDQRYAATGIGGWVDQRYATTGIGDGLISATLLPASWMG